MAFSFGFGHSKRDRIATAVTDDFEREYLKFIEEQKKAKQEREALKDMEKPAVQVSKDTVAAVDAIVKATEEAVDTEKTSKKKKKKVAEETVEL